ncbi:MAG TPA: permease prefix domain 1-containing protein, partial [Bryobacteraceae bacterium]|nr:permease prefix domain 1-containing protein [Bryobacteraceae bacterium]
MRWTAPFRSTLRWIFRRQQHELELDQELQSHLEQEIENNIRSGMSPDEARFAAQRLVGSLSLHKEECRDSRRIGITDALARDLRYAVRTLSHARLFTAIAIVTLALGIGANTTIFTFIENILLRQLPVQDPQQLVSLNWGGMVNVSYPNYLDFRDRNRVFSGLIACRYNPASISIQARDNSRAWGYEASGNYFQT